MNRDKNMCTMTRKFKIRELGFNVKTDPVMARYDRVNSSTRSIILSSRNILAVCFSRWCKRLPWWQERSTTRTTSRNPTWTNAFPSPRWRTSSSFGSSCSCRFCSWTWWWASYQTPPPPRASVTVRYLQYETFLNAVCFIVDWFGCRRHRRGEEQRLFETDRNAGKCYDLHSHFRDDIMWPDWPHLLYLDWYTHSEGGHIIIIIA